MRKSNILLLLIAVVLIAIAGYAYHKESTFQTYNQNLEQNLFAAMENESIDGKFIAAWRKQISGEFTDARAGYNAILHQAPAEIANKIQFNLANIYMQQAIDVLTDSDTENDESAFPLIELSKTIYRKLLADLDNLWPAKFNLELAVKIAPDTIVTDIPEDILPERSPENKGVIEEYKKLP